MYRVVLVLLIAVMCGCDGTTTTPTTTQPTQTQIAITSGQTNSVGTASIFIDGSVRAITFLDEQSQDPISGLDVHVAEDGDYAVAFVTDPAGTYAPFFTSLTTSGAGTSAVTSVPMGGGLELRGERLIGTLRDRIYAPTASRLSGIVPRSLDYVDSRLLRALVQSQFVFRERVPLSELEGVVQDALVEAGVELAAVWYLRWLGAIGTGGISEIVLNVLTATEMADAVVIALFREAYEARCYQPSDEMEVWNYNGYLGGIVGVIVLPAVPPPTVPVGQTLSLGGVVTDSRTGLPLPSTSVTISPGALLDITDAAGRFLFTDVVLDCSGAGGVQLVARNVAYERASYDGQTMGLELLSSNEFNFSLNPAVAQGSGALRIVLDWGAEPRDLDSHLWTPSGEHIYYFNQGSADQSPFAGLDVDDTNGHGPETITVASFSGGTYSYWVHKFAGDGEVAGSGARVRVFDELGEIRAFTAPSLSSDALWWHVFDIDGSTRSLTIVDELRATGGP